MSRECCDGSPLAICPRCSTGWAEIWSGPPLVEPRTQEPPDDEGGFHREPQGWDPPPPSARRAARQDKTNRTIRTTRTRRESARREGTPAPPTGRDEHRAEIDDDPTDAERIRDRNRRILAWLRSASPSLGAALVALAWPWPGVLVLGAFLAEHQFRIMREWDPMVMTPVERLETLARVVRERFGDPRAAETERPRREDTPGNVEYRRKTLLSDVDGDE